MARLLRSTCVVFRQVVIYPAAFLALRSRPLFTPEIVGYSVATGALASVHQTLLTKGLARERVGPAAAMQRRATHRLPVCPP